MSLDVYLISNEKKVSKATGIYVRENGINRELTFSEAIEKYPDSDIVEIEHETEYCFHANITHNLGKMAKEADLYNYLWNPSEDIKTANQLILPLVKGLERLLENPEHYKQFNSENGWGNYETLVSFVIDYLKACIDNPDSLIQIFK